MMRTMAALFTDGGGLNRRCSKRPQRLSSQTTLAKKVAVLQDSDYSFLSTLGHDRQLHVAILDVEHRVSLIALPKDGLSVSVVPSDRLSVDPVE